MFTYLAKSTKEKSRGGEEHLTTFSETAESPVCSDILVL